MTGRAQPKNKFVEYTEQLADSQRDFDEFTLRRMERECRQALEHPELGAQARVALTKILAIQKREEEALEHHAWLAQHVRSFVSVANHAVCLQGLGHHGEAVGLLQGLVEECPEHFDPTQEEAECWAVALLVRTLFYMGDRAGANTLMESALQHMNPNDIKAHSVYMTTATGIQDWGSAAVLSARWFVLKGAARWPEGGARQLLLEHPGLWEGTPEDEAIRHYLGPSYPGHGLLTSEDQDGEDIGAVLKLYEETRASRARALEASTDGT